jgi:DNA-binding response OmpR family regulator
VLVADDDADLAWLLGELLAYYSYEVTVARNGTEVLEAHPERFDAIVLDLRMPRLGGLEVKQRLNAGAIDVPVILVSADPETRRVAEEVGAYAYLTKPFDPDRLVALIAAAARSRRRREPTPAPIKVGAAQAGPA